jgi:hypothetical protein
MPAATAGMRAASTRTARRFCRHTHPRIEPDLSKQCVSPDATNMLGKMTYSSDGLADGGQGQFSVSAGRLAPLMPGRLCSGPGDGGTGWSPRRSGRAASCRSPVPREPSTPCEPHSLTERTRRLSAMVSCTCSACWAAGQPCRGLMAPPRRQGGNWDWRTSPASREVDDDDDLERQRRTNLAGGVRVGRGDSVLGVCDLGRLRPHHAQALPSLVPAMGCGPRQRPSGCPRRGIVQAEIK